VKYLRINNVTVGLGTSDDPKDKLALFSFGVRWLVPILGATKRGRVERGNNLCSENHRRAIVSFCTIITALKVHILAQVLAKIIRHCS
jgi:hypothetical protein